MVLGATAPRRNRRRPAEGFVVEASKANGGSGASHGLRDRRGRLARVWCPFPREVGSPTPCAAAGGGPAGAVLSALNLAAPVS